MATCQTLDTYVRDELKRAFTEIEKLIPYLGKEKNHREAREKYGGHPADEVAPIVFDVTNTRLIIEDITNKLVRIDSYYKQLHPAGIPYENKDKSYWIEESNQATNVAERTRLCLLSVYYTLINIECQVKTALSETVIFGDDIKPQEIQDLTDKLSRELKNVCSLVEDLSPQLRGKAKGRKDVDSGYVDSKDQTRLNISVEESRQGTEGPEVEKSPLDQVGDISLDDEGVCERSGAHSSRRRKSVDDNLKVENKEC